MDGKELSLTKAFSFNVCYPEMKSQWKRATLFSPWCMEELASGPVYTQLLTGPLNLDGSSLPPAGSTENRSHSPPPLPDPVPLPAFLASTLLFLHFFPHLRPHVPLSECSLHLLLKWLSDHFSGHPQLTPIALGLDFASFNLGDGSGLALFFWPGSNASLSPLHPPPCY